ADPNERGAGGAGAVGRGAGAALRGGLSAAAILPAGANGGGQLRSAGADRDRAGDIPPQSTAVVVPAAVAEVGRWTEPEGAGADPAGQRRISGGDAADEFCRDGISRLQLRGNSREAASG